MNSPRLSTINSGTANSTYKTNIKVAECFSGFVARKNRHIIY